MLMILRFTLAQYTAIVSRLYRLVTYFTALLKSLPHCSLNKLQKIVFKRTPANSCTGISREIASSRSLKMNSRHIIISKSDL